MNLQRLMPWLVGVLTLSALAMRWAAASDARGMSLAAALAFVAIVIGVAALINSRALRHPAQESRVQFHMLRRNTRLVALIYAWGAAAMLAVYVLGDLKWRHGWQYGAAMALAAAALHVFVKQLELPGNPFDTSEFFRRVVPLTLLHAGAAAGGLLFLIGSGKLATQKDDWAANHIFLAGGMAVVLLTLLTSFVHQKLRPANPPAR